MISLIEVISGDRSHGSTEIIFGHYRISGPLPFPWLSVSTTLRGRLSHSPSLDLCSGPAGIFLRDLSSATVRSDIQCLRAPGGAVLQAKFPALYKEKLTTRPPSTSVDSRNLQRLQPGAVRITRSPSWKTSSTDSTQAFHDFFHTLLVGQGLATSLLPPQKFTQRRSSKVSGFILLHTSSCI
ncbi:hypothetical protein CSKR_104805 [Clonorchis sinensis]|uniref:Uncharacterized protein n=1 Tax=Clonorchis sinensis TaxID=79923 RepID=A0A419PX27_CLOSI|nr:hypothetical protein CSKR_104805 [Clonorchis sinensis]